MMVDDQLFMVKLMEVYQRLDLQLSLTHYFSPRPAVIVAGLVPLLCNEKMKQILPYSFDDLHTYAYSHILVFRSGRSRRSWDGFWFLYSMYAVFNVTSMAKREVDATWN